MITTQYSETMSIILPVVHKGDRISDRQAGWDPSIFKKLNPLGGG